MWHRRVVLTGTLIALLLLCGGKGQASSDDLFLARGAPERPRDPYPGWYEWRIFLRECAAHAPASVAWEDPLDEPWWYGRPPCLWGLAAASAGVA